MPKENIHFCDEKWQKAIICEKLGINYFIDDRMDVLRHLIPLSIIHQCFLFRPEGLERQGSYMYFLPKMNKVQDWLQICEEIMK
jgi:hypothetical protein